MSNRLGAISNYVIAFAEAGLLRPDIPAIARAAGVSEGVVRNAIAGRPISEKALAQILAVVGVDDAAGAAQTQRKQGFTPPTRPAAPKPRTIAKVARTPAPEPEEVEEEEEEADPEMLTLDDLEPREVARGVLHRFAGPVNPGRHVHTEDQPTRRPGPPQRQQQRPGSGMRRAFTAVDYTKGN